MFWGYTFIYHDAPQGGLAITACSEVGGLMKVGSIRYSPTEGELGVVLNATRLPGTPSQNPLAFVFINFWGHAFIFDVAPLICGGSTSKT
jgi:hypothetical protein